MPMARFEPRSSGDYSASCATITDPLKNLAKIGSLVLNEAKILWRGRIFKNRFSFKANQSGKHLRLNCKQKIAQIYSANSVLSNGAQAWWLSQ